MGDLVSFSSGLWEQDFAEDSTLNRFYSAKEAVWSYANTLRITDRRVLAPDVSRALTAFLEHEASPEEITFIRKLIERDAQIAVTDKAPDRNRSLLNRLRDIDSKGFRLLEINEFIDLPILKASYKRAARKHHPDLGGNVADMQALNRAYSAFFELVNNEGYLAASGTSASLPSTLADWLFAMHLTLGCIYGDSYAADHAVFHTRTAHEHMLQSNSPFIGQFVSHFTINGIDRPCRVLARFGMGTELREIAKLTDEIIGRYIRDWLPMDEDDFRPSRDDFPRAKDFVAELGTKLVITNLAQAENAFRLGKIDQKRFNTAKNRAEERNESAENIEKQILQFAHAVGFPPFPDEPHGSFLVKRQVELVAFPEWNQDRVVFLSDEQKCEYHQAFSARTNLMLVEKYQRVRGNEILLGLIKNYEATDLEWVGKEIDFFLNLDQECFNSYELRRICDSYVLLRGVYEHLKGLAQDLRRQKLALLTEMDSLDKPEPARFLFLVQVGTKDGADAPKRQRRIDLGNGYAEFLELGFDELLTFQSTGYSPTDFHLPPTKA